MCCCSGVGKTHLSITLGREAILAGYTVQFTTATVLTIRGDSYRPRAKRKSGLIKPPAGDGPPVGSAFLRPSTGEAKFNRDYEAKLGAILHDAEGAVPNGV
jgi:IstB-like ATP binding protein